MRRTYRSKKDAGGGFDPKEGLQTVDEKSSAFDAFYIQNIKQTKREMSCVGASNQFGVASNKVRKRKYVKRIVKEVEPAPRESLSQSVFLTPDKSIRVNKAYDPFDMLLNSSPASKGNDNDSLKQLPPKRDSKTYTRRQVSKAKKYNFSSGDSSTTSESDKENSYAEKSYTANNTSDIRSHKLLVEKDLSSSPKYLDDSIRNIVNNISLLNNINHHRSTSGNTSFRLKRNRLTTNIQSPILQKSPLCSTPFKAKYRGGSIFKFSPISAKDQKDSPKFDIVTEEHLDDNYSYTNISNKNKKCKPTTSQDDTQASPVTSISLKGKINNSSVIDIKETQSNGSLFNIENANNHFQKEADLTDDRKAISIIKTSSIQTTEAEPFFGFSDNEESEDKSVFIDQSLDNTDVSQHLNSKNESILKVTDNIVQDHSIDSVVTDENEKSASITSDSEDEEKESYYDTCSSGRSLNGEIETISLKPTVEIERMNDSLFLKYYKPIIDSNSEHEVSDSCSSDGNRSDNDISSYESNSERLSSNSLNIENCNMLAVKKAYESSETNEEVISSNEEDLDSNNEDRLISFVTTRRRNEVTNGSIMSILDESTNSSIYNCNETVLNHNKNNSVDDSNVTSDCNVSNEVINPDCTLQENILKYDELCEKLFTNDEQDDMRKSVTVRSRMKQTVNNSPRLTTLDLNADCTLKDNTSDDDNYFTNNVNEPDIRNTAKSKSEESGDELSLTNSNNKDFKLHNTLNCEEIVVNSCTDEQSIRKSIVVQNSSTETPVSPKSQKTQLEELQVKNNRYSITTRKSSKLLQECVPASPESYKKTDPDWKPIVLQPGKKWERSLSIYRRMSMMTDHFDQSILEDEPMQTKGRKYRQSVISTMEMQEFCGSQHNESINSRRSTFISKPSRSTIRILNDLNSSRVSLCNTTVFDDSKGFLNDECDDTIIELSKLSIADAGSEVTVLDIHETPNRITTARDYVLRRCNQTDAILFDECYPDSVLKNCHKIGEGVYGEVFLWRDRDGRARVMKVVPVAGDIKVNGEDQKQFHEIISEIEIAMELSALRAPIAEINLHLNAGKDIVELDLASIENATDAFNEVRAVRCVYGSYPSRLLDLWDLYDECKGSENDNPAVLPADQQYIVLELANAGQDLESYQFNNAEQAHALFLQVAFALAVGEEAYQFEHRDLHWGNVLIASTDEKLATFVVRGRAFRVARCGVAATVIDYSLSRLTSRQPLDAVLYNDLSTDEGLFDAVGDYQFEVYRLMRDKLGNDWKNFEPYTNILWLHYTVDKMITALRYKRVNTKIHKHYIEKLKGIKNRILQYGSTVQFVLTDNEF